MIYKTLKISIVIIKTKLYIIKDTELQIWSDYKNNGLRY